MARHTARHICAAHFRRSRMRFHSPMSFPSAGLEIGEAFRSASTISAISSGDAVAKDITYGRSTNI